MFGDQAYWNESHRQSAQAAGIRYRINRRPARRPLNDYQRLINRRRSAARVRVEHAFHVVKRLWGFTKVRYRGLAKKDHHQRQPCPRRRWHCDQFRGPTPGRAFTEFPLSGVRRARRTRSHGRPKDAGISC